MVGRRRGSNDQHCYATLSGWRRSRLLLPCNKKYCNYILLLLSLSTTAVSCCVHTTLFQLLPTKVLRTSLHQQHPQRRRRHLHRLQKHYEYTTSTIALEAVSLKRTFLFDGGELQSFLAHNGEYLPSTLNNNNNNIQSRNRNSDLMVGCLTLVTGTTTTTAESRRVVGVQKLEDDDNTTTTSSSTSNEKDNGYDGNTISLGDNVHIYKHTAATIPKHISDHDALSTAAASLVGIHCALPNRVEHVGGSALSDADVFYSGRVVVLGGNDLACFFADGLATLGIDVSLVSTGGAKTKNKRVKVMPPSVESNDDDDDDEIGFANAIGQFDSLIDTLANERKGMIFDSSAVGRQGIGGRSGSIILSLLQSRHQCNKYISTTTHAQQIIKNDGILFGPGRANAHVKAMESISPQKCLNLVPSVGFGPSTLQTLFENNVIFPAKGKTNANSSSAVARGWDMKDFWEETSWPRDSSGTGVRYGLPVLEEEEEDDDSLDEAFQLERMQKWNANLRTRIGGEGGMDDDEVQLQTEIDDQNPYVTKIVGVDGLTSNILSSHRSAVVFVSMRSCRTCKRIDSMFTKMARECGNGLMYAKADTTGLGGKILGRQLGVVAVPAFVLFRDGIRYGSVSTSRLPSDRLDKAIKDLEAGEDFDTSLEEGD